LDEERKAFEQCPTTLNSRNSGNSEKSEKSKVGLFRIKEKQI
jgi:hypothetical protein